MKRDVHHICKRCLMRRKSKSKSLSHSLYTSLPIPSWLIYLWTLSKSGRDFIFVVVYKFSKMTYFIPCHKVDDACHLANLFLRGRTMSSLDTFGGPYEVSLILNYFFPPLVILKHIVKVELLSQLLTCFVGKSLRNWE
ncbi:hypothetical protein CR513_55936, partial [Mucuna pruriens]